MPLVVCSTLIAYMALYGDDTYVAHCMNHFAQNKQQFVGNLNGEPKSQIQLYDLMLL